MREITCEERDRLIDANVRRGEDGHIDTHMLRWKVGSSCTNFMGDGIFETTWVDADTEETALSERMERDGHDGWGDIVSCRHWVPEDERQRTFTIGEGMQPIGVTDKGTLTYPEGIEPVVIRTTERTNFKKCRRYWKYQSPLHLNLEPVKMNKNLAFGIAIHVGMESYYDPETWEFPGSVRLGNTLTAFKEENERQRQAEALALGGLNPERNDEYAEREQLGLAMLVNYHDWVVDNDKDAYMKPLMVEQKFQVPVPDLEGNPLVINGRPVVYQVRIDLVFENTRTGKWWICDHKTAGQLDYVDFLDLDTQLSSYAWAAQMYYDVEIEGILYNELVKKAPHKPKVLNSGKLSTDKRQLTTYKLYMQAIEENGLDPEPYRDMLVYLTENEGNYFRRTPVKRTATELQNQGIYVIQEAMEMLSTPFLYPNPTKMNCGGCDFRHPCVIENEGGDVQWVLEDPMMFRQRTSEDEELLDAAN